MGNEFEKEMSKKVKKSEKIEIKRKVSIRSILKLNNSSKFLKSVIVKCHLLQTVLSKMWWLWVW